MTDNSSNIPPKGYYYQPLRNGGRFETYGETVGAIVGVTLAQITASETGPWAELPEASSFLQKLGEEAGGMVGKTAGFYMDNAATIVENLRTLSDQLNDYRTWMDPVSSAISD